MLAVRGYQANRLVRGSRLAGRAVLEFHYYEQSI